MLKSASATPGVGAAATRAGATPDVKVAASERVTAGSGAGVLDCGTARAARAAAFFRRTSDAARAAYRAFAFGGTAAQRALTTDAESAPPAAVARSSRFQITYGFTPPRVSARGLVGDDALVDPLPALDPPPAPAAAPAAAPLAAAASETRENPTPGTLENAGERDGREPAPPEKEPDASARSATRAVRVASDDRGAPLPMPTAVSIAALRALIAGCSTRSDESTSAEQSALLRMATSDAAAVPAAVVGIASARVAI
jgi:hypothetical protein